jgi:hypothetical protein
VSRISLESLLSAWTGARAAASVAFALLLSCTPSTPPAGPAPAESSASATMLRAGAASVTVSPQPGSFIAGDARNRRFAGEHDPLHARAVAIDDGETTLAILVVDNIGLVYPDIEAIRRRAVELASVPTLAPERIIVSSTHSHSGPDVVGLWGENELSSGRDPGYMATLVESAARQVAAAAAAMRPVTLSVASGEHDLAWVENVTEPGLLDRRVAVLQLLDADGATVATLTNFACHPTVMDAVSDQVSSDYVAGFYRAMGERLSGEHLFLQGAIGGWVQPDKTGRSFELADRYGASVAALVLDLLDHARSSASTRIRFAHRRFEVPLENEVFSRLIEAGVLDRDVREGRILTEAAWFSIGDAQFVTHPGETSPAYSLASRKLMHTDHTFVMGLTLDALGYILKPEYFAEGATFPSVEYLTATSVGPQTGPLLMETLEDLVPR